MLLLIRPLFIDEEKSFITLPPGAYLNKKHFSLSLLTTQNKLERLSTAVKLDICEHSLSSQYYNLPGTNTLAYFDPTSVTKKKSFITWTNSCLPTFRPWSRSPSWPPWTTRASSDSYPGTNVIKLFTSV